MADSEGVDLVKRFLATMANRDLKGAEAMTGDGFALVASGNQRFENLTEFAANSAARQKSVVKHLQHFDALQSDDGEVVYCLGTMSGTWLDGSAYADVRFVDRFVVRDGRIVDMRVWSDMAEFRPR